MNSEWSQSALGEHVELSNGKARPEEGGRINVYGSNGIIGSCRQGNSPKGTIIIGRVGTYCGSLHFSKDECWVTDNAIKAIVKDGCDERYFFDLLKTCDLGRLRAGSGQPLLNQSVLGSIKVEIPPLDEQRAIAHILGTLDDKIEHNRKTNETLEAMAKALFKSWFVDFDPVRAKAEGRPTGLPAEISDLFPDSFEDSELGEIPSGWSIAALSDIAHISTGKRPESVADSRSSANRISVYGGAGIMGYTHSALIDGEPILATGRVGTLGVVNRVLEKAWISDNTLIINPGKTNFVYVYHYLLGQDLKSLNRGSTQPLISQREIKSLPIATPPRSLLSTFCELTQHWQERQTSLLKDNGNTKTLLDALLPKLISGEIRIPNAEKMLEEVGV